MNSAGWYWYVLYGFIVGRQNDHYGEPTGEHYYSTIVLPRPHRISKVAQ